MRLPVRIILLPVFCILIISATVAQQAEINFHHLTTKEGLNDGGINAICKDKYGFMWFGSMGALNRFDGSSIVKFTHTMGDSTTVPVGIVWSMACDSNGRLWIGYSNGLYEYVYRTNRFKKIAAMADNYISSITPYKNKLYINTFNGLFCYNTSTDKLEDIVSKKDTAAVLTKYRVTSLHIKNNTAYFGSYGGYIIYDLISQNGTFFPVKELEGKSVTKLMPDSKGYLWICNGVNYKFLRLRLDNNIAEDLNGWLEKTPGTTRISINDFIEDNNGIIWITTAPNGLLQYDPSTQKVQFHKHSVQLPYSIQSNVLRLLYRSPDNYIWVGNNQGVDYFNPSKNLFSVIYPFPDPNYNSFGRGMTEDKDGNFWFGSGDGVIRYNPVTQEYKTWHNEPGKPDEVFYNSIRSVAADDNNDVWIATGKGVNRYNHLTGKIEFFTIKDSIPQAFYFSANKDKEGNIWFGTKDYDGLYCYSPVEKKFHSISYYPVLNTFKGYGARIVFEDSKNRLWIGFNGAGLGMYDKRKKITRHWYINDSINNSINGDLVVDIKEDKKGIIWVTTFNGLNGIDPETNTIMQFSDKNGLRTTVTTSLAVDNKNRLWVGTAAGLMMLDSSRTYFKRFGESNGLPSIDFTEHPGNYLSNGDIMIPTQKGFIRFNPLQYKEEKSNIPVYITSISVLGKEFPSDLNFTNPVTFKPGENFFSLNFSALNFDNPTQTWYAYKLEGFDKTWQYTQIPRATYTNVPGGNYVLHYKATNNTSDWNVTEKTVSIIIQTPFYKKWWFPYLITGLILLTIFFFFRLRSRNARKVSELHSKAQLLEKEKAMVMYENLKQHLNPHFLFNSLTSLGSLITIDPKQAGNFLDKMSKVYRYILKNRDNETVPLSEELKFVQLYIDLQKTRFEDGLVVTINIDEEYYHRKIAPVTLQNLVENAIKHNTSDAESPLTIELFTENDYLIVRNNLQKKTFVETSNKQGLANMESLYRYLSSRPMEIMEDDKYFTIKIPLL